MLHLILRYLPNIPVIYNDTGVEFPETRAFVRELADDWNLNLHYARPLKEESFWLCVKKYGWPILGKAQAQSVEKALRSGNIRPTMSATERTLALNDVRVSSRCCEFTRERPTKRKEQELGADLKFVGIIAHESRSRIRLFVDHGAYYEVKRYFGRGKNIWKVNPLAIWLEEDVWQYHSLYGIPHCRLYDLGHKRNGCWPCAMGVRNGQLARLRLSHPKLFQYLILRTPLGTELLKARLAIKGELEVSTIDLKQLLSVRPCFFDRL
jgi:3'-phosphoadenosine 5'-phosphosulfate sulfotransferase (PAPS reductase)/FAD synthetase